MSDQDPQFGPLRRLDPAESDEQDVGRLEPIDPDAEETSEAAAAATPVSRAEASPPTRRLRDGLAVAVALAVLLSLSSIAAIGGLVAISMSPSEAPVGPTSIAPVESASAPVVIHVGENAQGPETPAPRERPSPEPAPAPVAVAPQPTAPPDLGDAGGGDHGGKGGGNGGHGGGKTSSVQGAWCDTRQGSACDATVGGGTGLLEPVVSDQGNGYIPSEEPVPDDPDDDDDSHSPSKGHSKH